MLNRQHKQYEISTESLSKDSQKTLTQLALEGIVPSDDLIADMALLDAGRLTPQQYKQRAIARATFKS